MGLDVWLYLRTTRHFSHEEREALSAQGLPSLVPPVRNPKEMKSLTVTEEVGYWRKEHTLLQQFIDVIGFTGDANCEDLEVSKEQLEEVLEWVIDNDADDELRECLSDYPEYVDDFVAQTVGYLRAAIAALDEADAQSFPKDTYRSVILHPWW